MKSEDDQKRIKRKSKENQKESMHDQKKKNQKVETPWGKIKYIEYKKKFKLIKINVIKASKN